MNSNLHALQDRVESKDSSSFELEIKQGARFKFGRNWDRFLSVLNEERILSAEQSLKEMLELNNLSGKSFLDAGSGSGLLSLAARRLGARVHSFDYDPDSVKCTQELRRRYFPNDSEWIVDRGSVLDTEYMKNVGIFDVVYSWGVLHHTGNMWQALENIIWPVASKGYLFIAIYNDQGNQSVRWRKIKRLYCSGIIGKAIVCSCFVPYFVARGLCSDLRKGHNPLLRYTMSKGRGMSRIYDWLDWLGGFPFEVAKAEDIFKFYRNRGFALKNLATTNGRANNQFVFVRD
jgi:2-polyprenyl-6-hydroxyphenyl methylase/3-demethylubiquinone-9 3-methyltransferase